MNSGARASLGTEKKHSKEEMHMSSKHNDIMYKEEMHMSSKHNDNMEAKKRNCEYQLLYAAIGEVSL